MANTIPPPQPPSQAAAALTARQKGVSSRKERAVAAYQEAPAGLLTGKASQAKKHQTFMSSSSSCCNDSSSKKKGKWSHKERAVAAYQEAPAGLLTGKAGEACGSFSNVPLSIMEVVTEVHCSIFTHDCLRKQTKPNSTVAYQEGFAGLLTGRAGEACGRFSDMSLPVMEVVTEVHSGIFGSPCLHASLDCCFLICHANAHTENSLCNDCFSYQEICP